MRRGHETPIHPGEVLAEVYMNAVQPRLTVSELADSIDVPPQELTEFIGGKRPVTLTLAARFAMRFKTTKEYWVGLQDLYEKEAHEFRFLRVSRQRRGS